MRWFKRTPKPTIRPDYLVYDMNRMKSWGHSAFWWPSEYVGEKACIFGSRPHAGDVLLEGLSVYIITGVSTPSNPGDQHFVEVVAAYHKVGRNRVRMVRKDLPEHEPTRRTILDDRDWIL